MPVKYSVVPKKNPGNLEAPAKYYMQAQSSGTLTLRQLAKMISDISTVSSVDTVAVLEAFLQIIPAQVAEGKIVKLGDFGNFGLTVKSEGSDTEAEVNKNNVKGALLRFRPGKEVKKVLDTLTFEKA